MELVVGPTGLLRFVYDETLDLHTLGPCEIRRGSHVEPDSWGRWSADLAPVGGPVLGPFPNRSLALGAEIAWLRAHWLVPLAP